MSATMESEVAPRRKSRFDMVPEDSVAIVKQEFQFEMNPALVVPTWVSVTDFAFKMRLDNALQRNFEYLSRKDRGADVIAGSTVASNGNNISQKLQNRSLIVKQSKLGIGIPQEVPQNIAEITSVYVAGLPLDISEEELDILFSSRGKIKKIKIYPYAEGKQSRDALITFVNSEAVAAACHFFDKLNIGDGFVISVSKADFQTKHDPAKEKSSSSSSSSSSSYGVAASSLLTTVKLDTVHDSKFLATHLPVECEVDKYAVVILQHAFDPRELSMMPGSTATQVLSGLEADMLLECCKFGKIVRLIIPEGIPPLDGCIVITFQLMNSAESCAATLNGRFFDGRQIVATVILPTASVVASKTWEQAESKDYHTGIEIAEYKDCHSGSKATESTGDGPSIQLEDDDDVDSFLNSLL